MPCEFSGPCGSWHRAARRLVFLRRAITNRFQDKTELRAPLSLLVLLLAMTCGATETAVGSVRPMIGTVHTGPAIWSLAPISLQVENVIGILLTCLCAVAATFAYSRFVTNSRRGRTSETSQDQLPLTRIPFGGFWRAHEDERKHLSRELHDSVGQLLTATGLQLRALKSASLSPEQVRTGLDEVCRLNAEALRLVRDLAMGLRPALLDDVNLITALEWQARQFSRQTGIAVSVNATRDFAELTEAQRTCIFRCVQEALTNCAKHAEAKRVRIELRDGSGMINVVVEDDGVGFSPGRSSDRGLGLVGMRERVHEVNGTFAVRSERNAGTRLNLQIPWSGGVPA